MYLLIFDRLQAERRISFVKGSLAFMTGVHSKVATIMKETESGTRCGRRTMYVGCRFIASGSISVMRYNNNNLPTLVAPAAITSPLSWHLTASSPPSAGTLLLPTFVWVSPL